MSTDLKRSPEQAAIDALKMYSTRGESLKSHAATLLEIYMAKKLKHTAAASAIWAGYAAIREEIERNEKSRIYWAGVQA